MNISIKPWHLIERAAARLRESPAAPPGAESLGDPVTDDIVLGVAPKHEDAITDTALPLTDQMMTVGQEVLRSAGLIDFDAQKTRLSEEFKIAQSQLVRAIAGNKNAKNLSNNVILITSARPSEGKSFVSINLAASLAHFSNRKILLVDADEKSGSLTDCLGLSDHPGFFQIARNSQLPIEGVRISLSIPGLSFISKGRNESLIGPKNLAQQLERLARCFPDHIILVDAAPCLASSDATIFAPTVGQIVLVVEAEKTQRDEIEACMELLEECKSIMLLLNKASLTGNSTFGAYGYGSRTS
jgi:receptor protein-tyrosine kinase